jgi:hypothetical protein
MWSPWKFSSECGWPGEVLEATLGWPPSDGADVTMVGSGDSALFEVLDVPEHLREVAPEGLAALSFPRRLQWCSRQGDDVVE